MKSPPELIYRIRAATADDIAVLPGIERRAAARFSEIGLGFLADGPVTAGPVFARACEENRLWVATCGTGLGNATAGLESVESSSRRPSRPQIVGFALIRLLAGGVHLQEMDVLPEHGRRGLGRRLVEAVLEAARQRGSDIVTLTTFRDVAWNAPFYRHLGFVEVAPGRFSREIQDLVAKEVEAGLVPDLRCVMEIKL